MAVLQPPEEGASPTKKKSFSQLFTQPDTSPIQIRQNTTYKGEAAVVFSREEADRLAAPYRLALVGKFSHGRPPLEDIRKFFMSLNLRDQVSVGLLDYRHVLLKCAAEADFNRIWTRGLWQLGTPLFVDSATASGTRPSVARACVEVDLLKPICSRVWVAVAGEQGFWQKVAVDDLPKYCSTCWRLGHAVDECKKPAEDLGTMAQRNAREYKQVEQGTALEGKTRAAIAVEQNTQVERQQAALAVDVRDAGAGAISARDSAAQCLGAEVRQQVMVADARDGGQVLGTQRAADIFAATMQTAMADDDPNCGQTLGVQKAAEAVAAPGASVTAPASGLTDSAAATGASEDRATMGTVDVAAANLAVVELVPNGGREQAAELGEKRAMDTSGTSSNSASKDSNEQQWQEQDIGDGAMVLAEQGSLSAAEEEDLIGGAHPVSPIMVELNIDQADVLDQRDRRTRKKGARAQFPSDRQLRSSVTLSQNSFQPLSHD